MHHFHLKKCIKLFFFPGFSGSSSGSAKRILVRYGVVALSLSSRQHFDDIRLGTLGNKPGL